MLRNVLFQVHWFVGITVGVILAVVGATGAMLSFEPEILHALNRDVRVATGAGKPMLTPPELLARLHEAEPGRRVSSLAVWSDPDACATSHVCRRRAIGSLPRRTAHDRRRAVRHPEVK